MAAVYQRPTRSLSELAGPPPSVFGGAVGGTADRLLDAAHRALVERATRERAMWPGRGSVDPGCPTLDPSASTTSRAVGRLPTREAVAGTLAGMPGGGYPRGDFSAGVVDTPGPDRPRRPCEEL